MPFSVVITTAAYSDIHSAIEWENSRSSGLGQRFLVSLHDRFLDISITPKIGSVRYDNVRCTATKIFKYLIHYVVDDNLKQVIILRVLHINRKPIW
ncbi:MAG: type II toxin-antitoxin system RelE/ParE family toxin [Chitinophagaceae bacterium]|nr:MAG: type II toxin-antitoxin system RelE/ParE family toxin [Chitinophagaceae bacterium]